MTTIHIHQNSNGRRPGGCLPAVASFIIPGLGQMMLGRVGWGFFHLFLAAAAWLIIAGPLVHIYSAYDASY